MGAIGFVLICAGEFEKGFELIQSSALQNPYCSWWFNTSFVFYYLVNKQYQEPLHWVEKLNAPDLLWDPLLKASVFGHNNLPEEADTNLNRSIEIIPNLGSQVKNILESFLLSPELNNEILEGLRKAGLVVKTVSLEH